MIYIYMFFVLCIYIYIYVYFICIDKSARDCGCGARTDNVGGQLFDNQADAEEDRIELEAVDNCGASHHIPGLHNSKHCLTRISR